MAPPRTRKSTSTESNQLRPGAIRTRHASKNSQSHAGVSPLNAVAHRNTGYQPLPRPLGLPPYRYSLDDNFPDISNDISHSHSMVFHVLGDSGGVKDAEFQQTVADAMITDLSHTSAERPRFCYHVGDVVYFNGLHSDYYVSSMNPTHIMTRRSLPFPATMTEKSTIRPKERLLKAGSIISCRPHPTSTRFQRTRRVSD